jgi:hypothetical protein
VSSDVENSILLELIRESNNWYFLH